MRWAAKQRQKFIAEVLQRTGRINRRDLCIEFEISEPQASIDLNRFRDDHPDAMEYDVRAKCYRARN